AVARALVEALLVRAEAEARVLEAHERAGLGRLQGPGHHRPRAAGCLFTCGAPGVGESSRRLDQEDLAVGDAVPVRLRGRAEVEAPAQDRLEVVLHEPLL